MAVGAQTLRHYARFWLQARIPVIRQGYGENQDGTPEGSKQDINMGEESILHLLPPPSRDDTLYVTKPLDVCLATRTERNHVRTQI